MRDDERYVIDLCDSILKQKAHRQHRFDFLRGDTGRRLPVDAYYPKLNLVIEFHERQHIEKSPFFDRRNTVSGVSRGLQRKIYDQRRRKLLSKHGLKLIEFLITEFPHRNKRRLSRIPEEDKIIVREKLRRYMKKA